MPAPTPAPERLTAAPWPRAAPHRVSIDARGLTPTAPHWSGELALSEEPALAAFAEMRDSD